ncbi:MAG: hypothetical protein AB1630_08890 [bacterium]
MHELISIIAKSGAIGVFTASLVFIFRLLEKEQKWHRNRLIAFFSACLVILAICIFAYVLEESKYRAKSHTELLGKLVAQTFMEPYKDAHGTYKYNFLPGTGLELECKEDEVFNKFDTKDAISSLWADPNGAWIKTGLNGKQLQVKFVRKGYGVDVTLCPEGRKPRKVDEYHFLDVTMSNNSTVPIAFRVRLTDERGTQWAWATEKKESEKYGLAKIWLNYKREDSSLPEPQTLVIPADYGTHTFHFTLLRNDWEIFPNDGNVSLANKRDKYFKFVQLVTLEFGLDAPNNEVCVEEHNKYLADTDSPMSVSVHKIMFVRERDDRDARR